jgi:hypothetical protein
MDRKKIATVLVGGTLALVTVFGAVTYRVVNAQATTPTPNTPASPSTGSQRGFGREMHFGGYTNADLAAALGITTDQFTTAQQSATSEALKQAVAAGLITQAQADQFSQNFGNGFPLRGLPFLKNSTIDYDALLASALNISVDDLKAGYQKAYNTNLDTAVTNGSITQEQADQAKGSYALENNAKFQASMKSAYEAAVNQAVADGVITQAQADLILKNSSNLHFGGMGGFGGPGGRGGHGGHGGPGDWGVGAPANPGTSSQSAPSVSPSSGVGL